MQSNFNSHSYQAAESGSGYLHSFAVEPFLVERLPQLEFHFGIFYCRKCLNVVLIASFGNIDDGSSCSGQVSQDPTDAYRAIRKPDADTVRLISLGAIEKEVVCRVLMLFR